MTIDENDIARMMKVGRNKVVKSLESLADFQVLDYEKGSFSPQIIFLRPRVDANNLMINSRDLDDNRNRAMSKVTTVIEYIKASGCRTRFIQTYFGELSDKDCQVCDLCLERMRNQSVDFEDIRPLIPEGGIIMEELAENIRVSKSKAYARLNEWIEQGRLSIDDQQIIRIV